jgi:hypothetical protein
MGPLIVLGVLAVFALVGVVAYKSWQAAQRRLEAIHQFALQHGFTYAAEDNGLPAQYDFALFDRGDGRGCKGVIAGQWEGVPVIEADYWYYTTNRDSKGNTSRSYEHFSLVIAQIDAWVPNVRVEHENLFTRLADHVGFRDIDFESEEFNRRFNVKGEDREFVFKLIDARMMAWLMGPAAELCVEVNGGHILLWSGKRPADKIVELFYAAKGFVDHVPKLVWNEYGKAAS